jgi:hypothetical protein
MWVGVGGRRSVRARISETQYRIALDAHEPAILSRLQHTQLDVALDCSQAQT